MKKPYITAFDGYVEIYRVEDFKLPCKLPAESTVTHIFDLNIHRNGTTFSTQNKVFLLSMGFWKWQVIYEDSWRRTIIGLEQVKESERQEAAELLEKWDDVWFNQLGQWKLIA